MNGERTRTGELTLSTTARSPRQGSHWLIVLLFAGLASTVLLTLFAGAGATFALVRNANPFFVGAVVLAQCLRYAAMTVSTAAVASIVNVRVRFPLLFQVTVAAQAANRTFVGGAAGFVVRLAFFLKQGMPAGSFAGVETVEDLASLCAISLLFVTGLAAVAVGGMGAAVHWETIGIFITGAVILAVVIVAIVRQRKWLESAVEAMARAIDRVLARIFKRSLFTMVQVHHAVEDFYGALALARRHPRPVFISFLCSVGRLGCDAIALYFAFLAVGYAAPPGVVLLVFVVSSSIATLSAIPGQIGVMEASLSVMSALFGIPAPVAVSATLLYRAVSFWLPIPFGYFFAWRLERRGLL